MQDNYEAHMHIRASEPWLTPINTSCTMTFNASDPCFVEWQTNGTGDYSLSRGTLFSTYRSSVSWDADADLLFLGAAGFGEFGFWPGYSRRTLAPHSFGAAMVKMQSANPSGTVKLRSRDPREAPQIDFNFFAENAETDLQALADGIEMMLRVFDDVGLNYTLVTPSPEVDVKQGIMDDTFSHHATSTCRMGPVGSEGYCVDSRFRVNGVDGLRVVDASVFPRPPGAMPNGPTFTISRKAFEEIVRDASHQRKS
jgi:choline dehydrogenase